MQRSTFGSLLTTKYTTAERSEAPKTIYYFVIPDCSDTSMSLKKCQKYFKGFLFLSTKAHLTDSYVKLATSPVLLKREINPPLGVWLLPHWHYGLGNKTIKGGILWKSGKPDICCLGGICFFGQNGVLVFPLLKIRP